MNTKEKIRQANSKIINNLKPTKHAHGFVDFIRGYGVIAIAIGLFLGTSLKTVVDSVVQNIVNPVVAVITGNVSISKATICIRSIDGVCKNSMNYGLVIGSVIEFIIAAVIIYLIVKLFRLDKLDKKKD